MPQFAFACSSCAAESLELMPYAQVHEARPPCRRCGDEATYAGLSAPAIGREQRFGAILADGTRVQGNLNKEAPRRRKPS